MFFLIYRNTNYFIFNRILLESKSILSLKKKSISLLIIVESNIQNLTDSYKYKEELTYSFLFF